MSNARNTSFQFSLLALFEYVTISCLLASLSGIIGMHSAMCLMAFALGLFFRVGWLAIATLSAAFIASVCSAETTTFLRELAITIVAGLICLWYIYRREALSPAI